MIKGIGDGEPIASERFIVGGHEWVLLFYPDGKRSSSEAHNINPQEVPAPHAHLDGSRVPPPPLAGADVGTITNRRETRSLRSRSAGQAGVQTLDQPPVAGDAVQDANPDVGGIIPVMANMPANVIPQQMPHHSSSNNDYCALFVALIGEADNPQGVVNTSEGRVVRAFHRFTLVDQSGHGHDISKGRRRDQGAVKISCARQDPNARNCHGYRKFVKKSILEDPGRGLLVNDTIVIRYQIELVVSTGGALSRQTNPAKQLPSISVPPSSLGYDLSSLLESGVGSDVAFEVDNERMNAHKIILQARSPVFKALLTGPMREGHENVVVIHDVRAPVFSALLHFAYSDELPPELQGSGLEVTMAQHLLAAADRFQLIRLRCICERRLCETVEVDTVATTLALAEQNNAWELKRVCLEFVSQHLQEVMTTEGYQYMITTCPQLQSELLAVIAATPPSTNRSRGGGGNTIGMAGQVHGRGGSSSTDGQLRRVRPRRE